eukprot:2302219-Rhodomonas_salina.1
MIDGDSQDWQSEFGASLPRGALLPIFHWREPRNPDSCLCTLLENHQRLKHFLLRTASQESGVRSQRVLGVRQSELPVGGTVRNEECERVMPEAGERGEQVYAGSHVMGKREEEGRGEEGG